MHYFCPMSKKSLLIIMDGWGHGKKRSADAIQNAHVPFVKSLYNRYPNSELTTCGELVGLPDGQMGNSEVGHLNIGAGRIVYQELQRINVAIRNGELVVNQEFKAMVTYCIEHKKPIHLIGLLSDGGVHSHIDHLLYLIDVLEETAIEHIFIHAFTDGRDTDPKSGISFLDTLLGHISGKKAKLATIVGRYFAMDRDKRWERVKLAYDALVKGEGVLSDDAISTLHGFYEDGITDEFIKPIVLNDENAKPIALIEEGDAVFCFNFRTDRCREITQVLTQEDFVDMGMTKMNLYYTTMTEYDKTYKDVHVIFRNDDLRNTLGEVLSQHGKTQVRIAETEKYPHVTFFFSGGREKEFPGEKRIMAASPKDVPTYDLKPEMSANEITELILDEIQNNEPDFVCLNYANPDMVGHTGVWHAVIKAVETVDRCVERVVTLGLEKGYTIFLTADHGNSDYMINEDGSPNTAHTLNPVPFFVISNDTITGLRNGKLGDIAPTILYHMGLEIPEEMTGQNLILES